MLSENFKQFSSNNVDILSNSQNNIKEIHELEKMTNSLSLSSINKNLLGRIFSFKQTNIFPYVCYV